MSRDTPTTPPKAEAQTISLSALFAQSVENHDNDITVSGLPPTAVALVRSEQKSPPVELSQMSKIWMLVGPGGGGKTVLARWLGGELGHRNLLHRTMLAALDPTNRTLTDFFEDVQQPPSTDPAETVIWLQSVIEFIVKQRGNAILDFGGGDVSLARTVKTTPTMADALFNNGIGIVAAYLLTPRVDDLASLVTFEQQGFRPRATALVLNLAKADTPAAFDAIRRQPAYRAAIDRGAAELWMPALSQAVSLRIEQARVQFRQARDGEAPPGRKPAAISLIERIMVREFLDRMATEFHSVESWLPWT
jgi:hypothetical protein